VGEERKKEEGEEKEEQYCLSTNCNACTSMKLFNSRTVFPFVLS
jgi:hypothetical protein